MKNLIPFLIPFAIIGWLIFYNYRNNKRVEARERNIDRMRLLRDAQKQLYYTNNEGGDWCRIASHAIGFETAFIEMATRHYHSFCLVDKDTREIEFIYDNGRGLRPIAGKLFMPPLNHKS